MSPPTPPTHPPPLQPAVLAKRYRLERRLAQGGMAEVWLGYDTVLSRQVAVKLLKPGLASDPTVAERFRREAVAAASLNHPNIVDVYDAVEEDINGHRRQAVIMQLISGKSLRELLDDKKRLSAELTVHIGMCVAAALDAAHKANLVHRDVKPGNILITPDARVLLTDFGIAKALSGDDDDLTNPNMMMGTAKYLSPEQVRGMRLDGRADLYSLGLVLYECLAGRVPFLGGNETETALARLNRDPTDLNRLRPTLPYGLAETIHRLLSRKPEARYATGALLRAELTGIAAQPNPLPGDHSSGFTPPHMRVADPGLARASTQSPVRPAGQRSAPAPAAPPAGPGAQPDHLTSPSGEQGPRTGRPAGAPVRAGSAATDRSGRAPANAPRAASTGPRPPANSTRPPAAGADRTPPNRERPRQQPNRQFDHRSRSNLFVLVLLAVAAVLAAILWAGLADDGDADNDRDSVAAPQPSTIENPTTTAPDIAAQAVDEPALQIAAYDPEGNDPSENDSELARAIDGNPDTGWATLCYANEYLGGKSGVGIVADLGVARTGIVRATIASTPYNVRIYASAADTRPPTYADWGDPIASDAATDAGTISVQLDTPARWVLVSFVQLGDTDRCQPDNPYRGVITELTVD